MQNLFFLLIPFLPDSRYHKHCPVPNCTHKPQKMSNHLHTYHPNLRKEEDAHYLQVAIRIPKEAKHLAPRSIRGQQTLERLMRSATPEPSEKEEEEQPTLYHHQGHQGLPSFQCG